MFGGKRARVRVPSAVGRNRRNGRNNRVNASKKSPKKTPLCSGVFVCLQNLFFHVRFAEVRSTHSARRSLFVSNFDAIEIAVVGVAIVVHTFANVAFYFTVTFIHKILL